MYHYKTSDILFYIKYVRNPTESFNINSYISFFSGTTRLVKAHKLKHTLFLNNSTRHSYFNRIPRLWNALPVINCELQMVTIKKQLKAFMFKHFLSNYNPNNSYSVHCLCANQYQCLIILMK